MDLFGNPWPGGGTGRRASFRSSCPRGVGVRLSPRSLTVGCRRSFTFQAGRRPVGPHEADFPVRVRGLGLRAGRCSAESHKLGGWVRLPCPQLVLTDGRVGKLAKPPAERLVRVGSTPIPATDLYRSIVPWSNGKAPGLHPGDGGSTPSGMTRGSFGVDGRLVQREDAWLAHQEIGVRFPGRPLSSSVRRKVAGYGSPGLTANECAPDRA